MIIQRIGFNGYLSSIYSPNSTLHHTLKILPMVGLTMVEELHSFKSMSPPESGFLEKKCTAVSVEKIAWLSEECYRCYCCAPIPYRKTPPMIYRKSRGRTSVFLRLVTYEALRTAVTRLSLGGRLVNLSLVL